MSDDSEKTAQDRPLNLDYYQHKKIYARVQQVVDLNKLLADIEKAHSLAPTVWFNSYKYDSVRSTRILYFLL